MIEEKFKPDYSLTDRTIAFKGVGVFGSKVLFAKPDVESEFLSRLRSDLHNVLEECEDIHLFEKNRKFNPHVTMFKVRHERRRGKKSEGNNKIEVGDIDGLSDYEFGKEIAEEIELLSMDKPKAADGYYFSEGYFPLLQ